MNISFSREQLRKRPIPQKKKEIIVNFKKDDKNKQEIQEEKIEPIVKIIDKRNDYELNRNEILEKLKQNKAFVVPVVREIKSKKPIMPIDIEEPKSSTPEPPTPEPPIEHAPEHAPEPAPEPSTTEPPIEPTTTDNPSAFSVKPKQQLPLQIQEPQQDQAPKKKRGRKKKEDQNIIIQNQDISDVKINDVKIIDRMPTLEKYAVNVSSYYLNNRKIFINKVNL